MTRSTPGIVHPAHGPRYVPLMAIGRGGMGRIDLALAVGVAGAEQLVVLKRLREPEAQTEEERSSLVAEALLSARLAHSNVCATLGLESLEGELVVVLEYLEGASLAELVRSSGAAGRALPRKILLRIVRDALAGLAHAHALADYDGAPMRIVHRDISPSNVLVTADGVAKVLDFGIAKAARSCTDTPPGFIKGKLGYMAPEQILGRAVDGRTDLYAIGVILWEGLTQRRFSAGDSIQVSLAKRLASEVPSARALVASVPADLDDIVRGCLQVAPEHRWPTAEALRTALERYVHLHGEDASPQDVARFVVERCGSELEARRLALRASFASSEIPRRAESVRRFNPDAPTSAGFAPRPRMGRLLPTLAGLAGVVASWSIDAVPSARAGAAASRSRRAAVIVGASRQSRALETKVGSAPDGPAAGARARGPTARRAPLRDERDGGDDRGLVAPPSPPSPPSSPPAVDATGFVTLDAYPWALVTIDGTRRGVTPMVHQPLSAGTHVVVFESPDHGRHQLEVHVREGETVAERWLWE